MTGAVPKERLLTILLQWQCLLTKEKVESEVHGFQESAQWWGIWGNITTHNAYHIGQIAYIRKQLQKGWKSDIT